MSLLFRQSKEHCSILWFVRVFFRFSEKGTLNKYCLWDVNLFFVYVDSYFDVPKVSIYHEKLHFEMLIVYSPILVVMYLWRLHDRRMEGGSWYLSHVCISLKTCLKAILWSITHFCGWRVVTILVIRGESRTAAISKTEHFVIIVNGFKALTIITKCSIVDVAAVLHPPLVIFWAS